MTDQSSNDQFHASSFMQGHNAEYLEQMYARYANDPAAVDEAWQAFFKAMGDDDVSVKHEAAGPSWARADWPPAPADDLTAALTGEWPDEPLHLRLHDVLAQKEMMALFDSVARELKSDKTAHSRAAHYHLGLLAILFERQLERRTPEPGDIRADTASAHVWAKVVAWWRSVDGGVIATRRFHIRRRPAARAG